MSGNLSFLNWLTIVAIVACFDDGAIARVLPRWIKKRAEAARERAAPSQPQRWTILALFVVYFILSVPALFNLMSSHQKMNYSFNRLHLGSAYGAFGYMGKVREEIVFEGTSDQTVTPSSTWREYEFPCKPGDVTRRPCIAAPYQYRLDWQIWFAPFGNWEDAPWTAHLAWKLLHNDPGALSLLAGNPFPEHPPRWIRALRYRYWFSDRDGRWWERQLVGTFFGPWNTGSPELLDVMAYFRWPLTP